MHPNAITEQAKQDSIQTWLQNAEAPEHSGREPWKRTDDFNDALARVIFDSTDHPMAQCHFDYIADHMCSQVHGAPWMSQPLKVLRSIPNRGMHVDKEKQDEIKKLLTKRWLGRMLDRMSEVMEKTDQDDAWLELIKAQHRVQLKVVPIVRVDDARSTISEQGPIRRNAEQNHEQAVCCCD